MLWIIRTQPRAQRILVLVFVCIIIFSLVCAFVNVQVFHLFGQPATYQLIFCGDFRNSVGSREAEAEHISSFIIALFVAAVAVVLLVLAAWLTRGISHWRPNTIRFRRVVWPAMLGLLVGYLLLAQWILAQQPWEKTRLLNPILAFAQSAVDADRCPAPTSVAVPPGFAGEFAPGLESVSTSGLDVNDSLYPVTLGLEMLPLHLPGFDNINVLALNSNKSMLVILGGIYHWVSYRSVPQEQGRHMKTLAATEK